MSRELLFINHVIEIDGSTKVFILATFFFVLFHGYGILTSGPQDSVFHSLWNTIIYLFAFCWYELPVQLPVREWQFVANHTSKQSCHCAHPFKYRKGKFINTHYLLGNLTAWCRNIKIHNTFLRKTQYKTCSAHVPEVTEGRMYRKPRRADSYVRLDG